MFFYYIYNLFGHHISVCFKGYYNKLVKANHGMLVNTNPRFMDF